MTATQRTEAMRPPEEHVEQIQRMTGRHTAEQVTRALSEQIAEVTGVRSSELSLSILSLSEAADGTTVVSVADAQGRKRAVVLCSPSNSPDMVDRAMIMANKAKGLLGPQLGSRILDPLLRGRIDGASYAVLNYCKPLSNNAVLSRLQNSRLRPTVFDWLFQCAKESRSAAPSSSISMRFEERLLHLASMPALSNDLRHAAREAVERIHSGRWKPLHVLMHGDCWRGNVLIQPADAFNQRTPWAERFVLIDWPGAEIDGYAIFDIVRMAQSMRISFRQLADELNRHCKALECERSDATSHLLAALGNLGMSLEHFPVEQFARMAEACHATLKACPV